MSSKIDHNIPHEIHDNNYYTNNPSPVPPTWEVLVLVSQHLDPKSLAAASCVSKSWSACFSSDHLWSPLCAAHFPSLSTLISTTTAATSLRRLYALGHAAHRLRHRTPNRPKLSLGRLLFALSLQTPGRTLTMLKPCKDLQTNPHGLFRFDLDVAEDREWTAGELKEARITWNVVMLGGEKAAEWRRVFTMAEERAGKGGFGFATSSGVDGWFSEELLPPPGMMSSGLVADLRLGMTAAGLGDEGAPSGYRGKEKRVMKIEKMSVGVISLHSWGYVRMDDALSYLEHFLPLSSY